MGHRIQQITVFVSIDDEGDEGVIGALTERGWLPFVASDESRARQLRPLAAKIAADTGRPVRVARFALRSDLEVISPDEMTSKGDGR